MTMNRKRLLALLLVAVMLFGMLPVLSYADDGVQEVTVSCGVPGASVKIYSADAPEVEIQQDGDGYYRLLPGSYYYTAEAEGYAEQGMTPFTVTADGGQTVNVSLTPKQADTGDGEKESSSGDQTGPDETLPASSGSEGSQVTAVSGGIFGARYSRYQVFNVYRSPAYPSGSQESPSPFTVMDLSAPDFAALQGGEDYFYFAPLGPASQTGVAVSGKWYADAEGLDPYAVVLHAVKDGRDTEVARGVIGALSAEGFLFDANGAGAWFSNNKGYHYASTTITYKPVAGGRLVCDVSLLTGCAVQSMLEPADDAPDHVHEWSVESDGATAVYRCVADYCPCGDVEYTMSLSIPAVVPSAGSAKAVVLRACGDAEWPAELEQDVVYYLGRGETEYARSTTPPSAEGTYTATVSVGYRYLPTVLTADFAIGYNVPVAEETPEEVEKVEEAKPFSQTQSVNGVVVTVSAPAEAFPADAVLSVTSAAIDEAMDFAASVQRGEALAKVAASAVEVKVVDKDGNALQTADGSPVSVALSLAEPAANGMTTAYYRIMRDWEGYIYAEPQAVNANGGSIMGVDLNGSLLYVVEVQKRDMPAKDFENYTGNLHVMVSAPEGAFPRGTEMFVTPVYDQEVLQAIGDEVGTDASQVTAVDITFKYNNEEIEPLVPISVTLKSEVIAAAEEPTVVHMDDEGNTEVMEQAENAKTDEVSFEAESFSVYAVVDVPGDYARAKVNFYITIDGTDTLLGYAYVKNADTRNDLNTILVDPGVGDNLADDEEFEGWTLVKNYSGASTRGDIDYVRDYMFDQTIPAPGEDGQIPEYNFYAVIAKIITLTYMDENALTVVKQQSAKKIGTDADPEFTLNAAYTPDKPTANFEGWIPATDADAGKITTPIPADQDAYKNGDKITVTSSVNLKAYAPEGCWLIFEQNGSGATYNAPQFVKTGAVTKRPRADADMTRKGYSFGGWYETQYEPGTKPAGVEEFVFGQELTEGKTLYAYWIPNTVAPYTIVFYTQNGDRSGYDLADSYTNTQGAVGTNIQYTSVNNGDEDYATVPGVNAQTYHYQGFNLTEASKNQQVEITPDGEATLKLYYDRVKYELRFYLYWDSGGGNNRYSYAHYPLSPGSTTDPRGNVNAFYNSNNHPSTSYSLSSVSAGNYTAYYFIIEAYYGDDISDYWPEYGNINAVDNRSPVSFIMMNGAELKEGATGQSGQGTVKGLITRMDEKILGLTNDADGNFLIVRYDSSYNNWRYHIWYETVEGETYTNTQTWGEKTYYEVDTVVVRSSNTDIDQQNPPQFTGFEYRGRRNQNWNGNGSWTTNNPTLYHINYVYDRLAYPINYMDGIYVDPDNTNVAIYEHTDQILKTSDDIVFGYDVSEIGPSYKPTASEANEVGFVFEGWYADPACQTPMIDGDVNHWTTMPVGGITVYAKWVQKEYRVLMHPNAGTSTTDPSLSWGDEQATTKVSMSFKLEYEGKVSLPTGVRDGYEFIGWYADPDFANVYPDNTALTDDTTEPYDKSEPTELDKWGQDTASGWNKDKDPNHDGSDADERFWVLRKLEIYAKWKQIPVGALGIGIEYVAGDNPDEDPGLPTDSRLYEDATQAVAQGACNGYTKTTTDEVTGEQVTTTYVFKRWVVQKYENNAWVDTSVAVNPGGQFTVILNNAKQDIIQTDPDTGEIIEAEYTIRLKAEYTPLDNGTPTHIDWYPNYDENITLHRDKDILINEAVDIYPTATGAPTRDGYAFLGWARVPTAQSNPVEQSDGTAKGTVLDLSEDDVYLKWDGSKYQVNNGGRWITVTQVAADEKTPYHDMYAVWKKLNQVTVTKTVTGNTGDRGLGFTFTIEATGFTPKETTFTLAHGDEYEILGIPDGASVTITETAVTGYTTKYKIDSGSEVTGNTASLSNITADMTVEFTNTSETTPDTGISLTSIPFVLMLSLSVLGFGGFMIRRRREEK